MILEKADGGLAGVSEWGDQLTADRAAHLDRRYEEEMRAAEKASSREAKVDHLELAFRYAIRARDAGPARFSKLG